MEIKVAFYIAVENLNDLDYSTILKGNPGIGGTEYEFLLVPYLLEKRDNRITPFLLTRSKQHFPHKNVQYVNSLKDACDLCVAKQIPTIIINQGQFDQKVLEPYKENLSFILWAHNNISYSKLSLLSKLNYVKRIVCCGREMQDLYRDHIATFKSTYVYNIFPTKEKKWYLNKIISQKENHNVVYMGCLAPQKSFHVLARAWKDVLKKVPDAQLYVIGNGRLYDSTAKLGKYGLASEEYESLFMSYLSDKNGILPSVHFMGLMGIEKFNVIGQCKVGVPNPTGYTETFCICALEMQLMGCKIVSIKHPAYLDTVYNPQYLYTRTSQLADNIAKALLSEQKDSYDNIYQFITTKFGIEDNIQRWEEIIKNPDLCKLEKYSEKSYQMKPLKDFLLHLKKIFPFLNSLPPVERFYNFYRIKIQKCYK